MSPKTQPPPVAVRGMPQGEGFYRRLIDDLADGVYFVDTERRITFWSRGAERITGHTATEVIGSRCADNILTHVDANGVCLCTKGCPLAATMQGNDHKTVEMFLRHKEGHRVPVSVRCSRICDRQGQVIGCVETFHQNTSQQSDLARIKELEELAFLDTLTGLANRRYVESLLATRFSELARHSWRFGVIMLDVDHFKRFNDEHGHDTGDRVLQMVATTLSQNCRPHDTIGRWGGEEFLIVLGGIRDSRILVTAERLRVLVARSSLRVAGASLQVTMSLGSTAVRADDDSSTLLRRVDKLLYKSKSAGRNRNSYGE